jgi:hypothetical protein
VSAWKSTVTPAVKSSVDLPTPAAKASDVPHDWWLNCAPAAVRAASARPVAWASTAEALRASTVVAPQRTAKLKPPVVPAWSRSKRISTRSPAVRKPAGMVQVPMLARVLELVAAPSPLHSTWGLG